MWEPIEQRLAPSCTVLRMQDPRCNKPQNKRTSKSGSCRKVSRIRKTKPPEKQRNPNFASQINPASDFHESPDQIFPGIIMQENSQHTESQMELSIAHEELQATQEIFTYENPLPVNRTQDLQLPRDASRNVSRSDICYDPRPQHSHTSYEYRGNMVSSEKDQPQTSREMVSDGLTSLDSTFHESTGFSSNAHGQAVEPSLALGNMASPEFDELIRLNMHQGGVPVPDVFLDFHNPTGFSNAHGQAVEPSLALGNMASPEFDELIRLNMHQGGVPVPDVTLGFHNPTGFSNTHGQAVEPSLALGNMASPEFDELIRLNMHQGGVPVPDVTLGFHNPTGFSNTHGQAVEPSLAPGNMPSPELDELIRLNMHQSGALVQDTSVRFHNPTNIAFPIPHSQTIENPSPSTEPIICSA
ncbi:hypothetical protein N7478_003736 [Penicillium angulare]|uniref:uncharacterized protein n=1 Tax=Penicillium angulare TaxID=116970 RepID=UPI002541E11E|nr:uncharacterized protein N7478_003736 [Penicillium angulare]KAJ5288050.1 hypothetical protein N7478_003736 [Penicillium angulare]